MDQENKLEVQDEKVEIEKMENEPKKEEDKKKNKKWLLLLLLLLLLCFFGFLFFKIGLNVGRIYKPVSPDPIPQKTIIRISDSNGEWGKNNGTTKKDKIKINPGSLSLETNESSPIYASTTSTNPIYWTSSDESCITISPKEGAKPTVTAGNKECTAVIRAQSGDAIAEILVTVVEEHDKLKGIKLEQSDYTVYIGQTELVSVIAVPTTAKLPELIYKITDTTIATVDENGVIRGVSEGKTTLIVTTADGSYTSKATITVKDKTGSGDKIEINPGSLSLETNESSPIYASTTSTNPIYWTSSDESCITISPKEGAKPTVTAGNKECTAVIRAQSGDAIAEILVTVVEEHDKLKGIKLEQSDYTVYIGQTELVSVIAVPTTAKLPELIYKITDTTIATVDENGVIRGVSEGKTTLIVTTADGSYTSKATVTVKRISTSSDGNINEINIFSLADSNRKYIAPYDKGMYEFEIKNTISENITYNLSLEEKNPDKVNIKYKLKKNGNYIIGENGWVYYDKIILEEVSLSSKTTDIYELEWCWVSENNELDTYIGTKEGRSEYNVTIKVVANEDIER